jgi:hypothetical protein
MARRNHLVSVPTGPNASAPETVSSPSRRRPRRDDIVRYRVLVKLIGAEPALWRRLELASDLFLDEVHEAIQTAFGWTDSHLHQFGSGPDYYSPETEYYLCPFEREDAGPGVPEEDVRLDEVLVDPGDKLFYLYDFGDSWDHVIELEGITPRDDSAPRASCLDGRRDGPPEDCGGLEGYQLVSAAADPDHRDHAAAVAEFEQMYGVEFDAVNHSPVPFLIDAVNTVLAERFPAGPREQRKNPPRDLPAPLDELLSAVRNDFVRRELRWLIGAALDGKPGVDLVTATRMVRPYTWLLDLVGDEGIRLTSAGYLPPAQVAAAFEGLALSDDWIGKGNREAQTRPVLLLRETAAKLGLLRKQHGLLLLTALGRKLRSDPVALWWHVAERMPLKSSDRFATQAGLTWLLAVAARPGRDPAEFVAQALAGMGWRLSTGSWPDSVDAASAAFDIRDMLRRLGGVTDDRPGYGREILNADGATFARAAVATWPTTVHR